MQVVIFLVVMSGLAILYFMNKEAEANKTKKRVATKLHNVIHSKVVGVTFKNKDGSSRQKNIKRYVTDDMELHFKGYQYKPGQPAIAILAKENDFSTQIDNISAELVETILNSGDDTEMKIVCVNVTGGTPDKPTLGVNIEIRTSEEL